MSGSTEAANAAPSAAAGSGSNSSNSSGGGFDLFKAIMSNRSAATDEDGPEQLGFETPRSGVATPRPDPHDKRLPGIMSYFTQVRPGSLQRLLSGPFLRANPQSAETSTPPASRTDKPPGHPHGCHTLDDGPHLLPHEMMGPPPAEALREDGQMHSYPTPPASQRSSQRSSLRTSASLLSGNKPVNLVSPPASRPCSLRQASATDWAKGPARRPSALPPLAAVNAGGGTGLAGAALGRASTEPNSPTWSPGPEGDNKLSALKSASVTHLQKLTGLGTKKSGQNTPRALSVAHPYQPEHQDGAHRLNGEGPNRSPAHTAPSNGAHPPAARGKLTVKIVEARGLRSCREPYIVAVFQRNELISPGPRAAVEDKDHAVASIPIGGGGGGGGGGGMGGVPISRQGSDSGRPMAIPMRSRQSSSTSTGDQTTFRNRPRSITNPKWDAEAVFDVVDTDMLVDVSVYDQLGDGNGEAFLGHVDFSAQPKDKDGRVRGWFPLRGHADTVAGDAPSGEIYVEAYYQRAEQKHFGPEDFQIIRLIGKGTFGQVYQVRKRDTSRIYAMKVLSKKVIVQKKEVAHTVGERNILVRTAMTDSPFIVGLKFSFQTPSDLYLVTDYMSGGELFWHLQKEGKFDEKRAKFYIAELILAIEHLHKNDIVYRDLKPENILLDANGHIALCDFGLSKANLTKNDTTNTFCGTTEYLAPEVLLDESGYTKMVDFWSLGVLVFEMCCGWSPFYADDTQQMYKNIAFGKVRFPRDTLSLDGRNFVKGLLNRNPRHRLGATDDAAELKRHAFFQDVDWTALSKKLITPPFRPQLKNALDVSYFDPEFTNAMVTNGSLNERALALAGGYSNSTPLSPTVQANFHGFTYVDQSTLDEVMRGRYDDEEMDDVHDHGNGRRDEDWDGPRDVEFRRGAGGNRMSGVVKTAPATGEENMFNDASFDM